MTVKRKRKKMKMMRRITKLLKRKKTTVVMIMIREETGDKLERLGSKLATNSKDQGEKWLFLNYWSKSVKMTKPQGAKRKLTLL
ncbi:hypothetical protein Hanom_Chr04g00370281 [Helianthus anomalus]